MTTNEHVTPTALTLNFTMVPAHGGWDPTAQIAAAFKNGGTGESQG